LNGRRISTAVHLLQTNPKRRSNREEIFALFGTKDFLIGFSRENALEWDKKEPLKITFNTNHLSRASRHASINPRVQTDPPPATMKRLPVLFTAFAEASNSNLQQIDSLSQTVEIAAVTSASPLAITVAAIAASKNFICWPLRESSAINEASSIASASVKSSTRCRIFAW